jgi:hypothetical protein
MITGLYAFPSATREPAEGLKFPSAWEARCVAEVEGVKVAFVGREQLLVNKRAVGRPQHLADVSE